MTRETVQCKNRWNQVLKPLARDQQAPPPPQQQQQHKRRKKKQQQPNSKYSSLNDSILFIPMAEQQHPISMPELQHPLRIVEQQQLIPMTIDSSPPPQQQQQQQQLGQLFQQLHAQSCLLLGMVYSNEHHSKRGQEYRDRVRCAAL